MKINNTIENLLAEIQELEKQLEIELHKQTDKLRYRFTNGKIEFEREVIARHKALKTSLGHYVANARWLVILTAPAIYIVIIPFVLLDILISFYQLVCFPVYGIPKVTRSKYLVFDRAKLDYLNGIEKFNCLYCSYGNGIIAFAREVAARTEQYWCPIKHSKSAQGKHTRYHKFTNFGDAEQYRNTLKDVRTDFDDS